MQTTKDFEQWLVDQQNDVVRYQEIEKSELLAEYKTLKQIVEAAEFQEKKTKLTTTKYADTPEGKTMARYDSLKWNISVILYNIFSIDSWKTKADVAEYLQLDEQVKNADFQKENAFWKNENRWWTTPEGKQDKRYEELAKHEDIKLFLKYTKEEIEELKSYKQVWNEEFDAAMGAEWKTGFVYPSEQLIADHSHVSEQQAYVKGQNTQVSNSVMTVLTKKQAVNAAAWHPTKGMLMKDFTYSSDVWHTAKAVVPATGVLLAKVLLEGNAKHTICLTTPKMQHTLPVLHEVAGHKGYAIYTLVWNAKEVIAYVNDQEVARTKNTLSGEKMHILMRSYIPENQDATNATMNVDWIRVYEK